MKSNSIRLSLVPMAFALAAVAAHAQASKCPAGSKYIGDLSGTGSFNSNLNSREEILLPVGIKLDSAKQQSTLQPAGGGSSAKSSMKASEVPAGLFIAPDGSEDYNKGWAVHSPALTPAAWQGDTIKQFKFALTLYCTTGSNELDRLTGPCTVRVPVCVFESLPTTKEKAIPPPKPQSN